MYRLLSHTFLAFFFFDFFPLHSHLRRFLRDTLYFHIGTKKKSRSIFFITLENERKKKEKEDEKVLSLPLV